LALFGFDLIQHCRYLTHLLFLTVDTLLSLIRVETVETVEWVEPCLFAMPIGVPTRLVLPNLHSTVSAARIGRASCKGQGETVIATVADAD
jgi:hypothetical protein